MKILQQSILFLDGFVHLYHLCVCVCIRVELYMCSHARVCFVSFGVVHVFLRASVYVCFLAGDEPVLYSHVRSNRIRPQVLCAETARALQ